MKIDNAIIQTLQFRANHTHHFIQVTLYNTLEMLRMKGSRKSKALADKQSRLMQQTE